MVTSAGSRSSSAHTVGITTFAEWINEQMPWHGLQLGFSWLSNHGHELAGDLLLGGWTLRFAHNSVISCCGTLSKSLFFFKPRFPLSVQCKVRSHTLRPLPALLPKSSMEHRSPRQGGRGGHSWNSQWNGRSCHPWTPTTHSLARGSEPEQLLPQVLPCLGSGLHWDYPGSRVSVLDRPWPTWVGGLSGLNVNEQAAHSLDNWQPSRTDYFNAKGAENGEVHFWSCPRNDSLRRNAQTGIASTASFIHSFIQPTLRVHSMPGTGSAGVTPMKETNVLHLPHPTQKRCCHWLGMSPWDPRVGDVDTLLASHVPEGPDTQLTKALSFFGLR